VAGGILDADELAAVRDVLGEVLGTPMHSDPGSGEARPIALIADDRVLRTAQPEALRLAARWCAGVRPRLLRGVGLKVQVHVDGAETVNGAILRESIEHTWVRTMAVAGKPGAVVLSVSGPIVETVAAIVLGADPTVEAVTRDRPPSETARGVFTRVGDSLVGALAEAWRDERTLTVTTVDDATAAEALRGSLISAENVISLSVSVSGATSGQMRLFALPEVYAVDLAGRTSRRAPPSVYVDTLSSVPVEVMVQIGTAPTTMNDLTLLEVGQVIVLDRATDEPLPLTVAGVLKAYGTPVITRGVLGVEIVPPPADKELK
jgi:flagellar motor switch protein FliM